MTAIHSETTNRPRRKARPVLSPTEELLAAARAIANEIDCNGFTYHLNGAHHAGIACVDRFLRAVDKAGRKQ